MMELTGKVIAILPPRSGVTRNGEPWKNQDFVLETQEQYPKKMVFNIFGEDKINQAAINIGDIIKISFDINAREFNGRWYNDIRAWKVEHEGAAQITQTATSAPQAAAPAPQAQVEPPDPLAPGSQPEKDDLPF